MTAMSHLDLVTYDDNSFISNATVSGNLHDCRPLFVDEYGILLCASGYVKRRKCSICNEGETPRTANNVNIHHITGR